MITSGISATLPTGTSVTAAGGSRLNQDTAPSTEFRESLQKLLTSVESSGKDANDAVMKMADGSGDVHDAMIALQRAETMLQLTVQMRNKLVQAYQEIMRMPV